MASRIEDLIVVAISVVLAAAWLAVYPFIAGEVADLVGVSWIEPRYEISFFYIIPVLVDRGSMAGVALAIVIASIPVYVYIRRIVKIEKALDEQVAELLTIFSGLVDSTGSISEALLRASKIVGEPLGSMLTKLALNYRLTGDLEASFNMVFSNVPRRVRLLAHSIVVASRAGGRLGDVLARVAAYARESSRLSKVIKSRLAEYGFTVALASIVYSVAAGIILGLVGGRGGELPGLSAVINVDLLAGLYFYSLLVIVFASSIVIARIIHGYTLLASRYIGPLVLAAMAAFYLSPLLVS